jgi:uncharacterized protein YbbK (DUF523 family)
MYLVSACLVGINCRYDGKNSLSEAVVHFLQDKEFVPVCPELLGGLGVPRRPCRFSGGDGKAVLSGRARVLSDDGDDMTARFISGAQRALAIAELKAATAAILNERSPSCGVREVYIDMERTPGLGVAAWLLKAKGIELISDEDI